MEYKNTLLQQLFLSQENIVTFTRLNETTIKVASALANGKGGIILIGIDDNGCVTGVTPEDVKDAIGMLSSQITPSLPYTFNVLEEGDKSVLLISIWEGANKPYTTSNSFFVQVGDVVTRASLEQVDSLFEKRRITDESWERKPNAQAEMSDLSETVYHDLKEQLLKLNRCNSNATMEDVCKCMGFISGSNITNAGVVVMADHPSEVLPQTRIRVSMFGAGGAEELISVRLYDGSLVNTIEEITQYITSLYPTRIEIINNKRTEVETLPRVALREGLLNAVVHRAYEPYNSSVVINLYADSVQIINTGELPESLTVDDLMKEHTSILRNPDIANAFFILGYIETAGSGIQRIVNECRRNRCEVPEWKSENGQVTLTFPSVYHNQTAVRTRDWQSLTTKLSTDEMVTTSLARILEYISTHEQVKLSVLSELTGKSYPTVKRYMQTLKDAGLVTYEGNNRSGGWRLSI